MITNISSSKPLVIGGEFKPRIEGDKVFISGGFLSINNESRLVLGQSEKGSLYLKIQNHPLGGIESLEVIMGGDIEKHIEDNDRSLVHFLPLCEINGGSIKNYFEHTINFYKINYYKNNDFKGKGDFDFGFLIEEEITLESATNKNIGTKVFKKKGGGFHFFYFENKRKYNKGEVTFEKKKFLTSFEENPSTKFYEVKYTDKEKTVDQEYSIVKTDEGKLFTYNFDDSQKNKEITTVISALGVYSEENKTYLPFNISGNIYSVSNIPISATKESIKAFNKDIYGKE